MTQVNRTTFKAATGTLYPDNTNGEISPADLRSQIDDIADSTPFNVLANAPLTGQLTVWSDDKTILGTTDLVYASGNLTIVGNIVLDGTVDGRDIDTDGTKLDTIETAADVTDTSNVTTAGALMDSELTSLVDVKAINQSLVTTASPVFATVNATTLLGDGASITGVVTPDGVQTLTNKTITSVILDGTPTATTATATTNTTQVATTAMVQAAISTSLVAPTVTYLTSGTAATYTTPADVKVLFVEVLGAGGGSGGVDGQGAGTVAHSRGGGAGGYLQKRISAPDATYTYTVGAAGSAGAAGDNSGGNGGTSTFTDGASITLSSGGGVGGGGMTGTSGNGTSSGALGGVSSGGDLNVAGNPSSGRSIVNAQSASLSEGGASMFGSSGISNIDGVGGEGLGYGSGAGGSSSRNSTANYAGALGSGGLIKIMEFY
jgi:hypothetical protein